ncbi:MAG: FimV/HubP family polar landmark protein, partial [Rubrivivax sp.]|nr:FimV/HubP family polar landmark protein [Rubrivivax sp.]
MNHRPSDAARFALNGVAFAAACLWASQAWALGLGRLTVTSALGETLRAEIEITSMTPEEASSLQLRIASPEAYRAAGVEYNAALPAARAEVVRRPDGRSVVRITGERAVLEPFVDVIIEASWTSGRLVREYTMLFDPPRMAQAPAATTAPVVTPAPALPPAAAAPAAPAPPRVAAAPARPAPRPAPIEPPRVPVAGAAPSGDSGEIRVRPGDSLSRIAQRTLQPGISLDQMLVSLFRGNPQAFMGENMNRLKSGAVLSVPSAETAGKMTAREARDVIVAQSADFAAYRQRLATGTTTEADATATRQARGQVQTQVDDRKQAAAATPDRLKLSQGSVQASAAEARSSREAQTRADSARLAELARNVDELKKLQGATAPASPAPAAAPAPATAAAPGVPAPTVVAAAPPPPPAP